MNEKLVWKAEVKFVGSPDEFNKFSEQMEKLHAEIAVREWRGRPNHFAGCTPIPIDLLLGKEKLEQLAKGLPQIQIKFIKDIYGGMRVPHFHLGDKIVLLDRARFKEYVRDVAEELGGRRAERIEDYIEVMNPIGHMGDLAVANVNPVIEQVEEMA